MCESRRPEEGADSIPEGGHEHTIDGWLDDDGAWHYSCSDDDCTESVVRP